MSSHAPVLLGGRGEARTKFAPISTSVRMCAAGVHQNALTARGRSPVSARLAGRVAVRKRYVMRRTNVRHSTWCVAEPPSVTTCEMRTFATALLGGRAVG